MLRARRILMVPLACLVVATLLGACNLNIVWGDPTGAHPFGLGDNGQANVTLDGNYVDVTIDGGYSHLLSLVEDSCINNKQAFETYNNCFLSVIGHYIPGGYLGNIEQYAMQDPWCVVPGTDDPSECVYGQSMYGAFLEYGFGLGGNGCVGFRINLITQQFEQKSWYAESYAPSHYGTSNLPGQAWCYAS